MSDTISDTTTSLFHLPTIAGKLESLEESILFRLLDRAQYKRNSIIYTPGAFPLGDDTLSLVEYMLKFGEETFAVLGRYTVAEERPFYSTLPSAAPNMSATNDGLFLANLNDINLTKDIRIAYRELLTQITEEGDDEEYGTSAEYDLSSVQAIARRIHYGSFYVAEAKYRGNPEQYQALINANDTTALMALLTRQEIEDRIIERISKKVDQIQAIANPHRRQIDATIIAQFYFDTIIPLTKVGEIQYLLGRRE